MRRSAVQSGRDGRRRRLRGFTIVELLVVMVIFGMLVAFAAPRVDISRFRVNSAMQVLGSTMLTVQRQAVTQQHDVIVRFDTAQRVLRIHEDRDNDGVVDNGEHTRAVQIGEGIRFGRGNTPAMSFGSAQVTFTHQNGGLLSVTFHRDGSASEAGGFYVTSLRQAQFNRATDDTRAIVVARATGRATFFRYRGGAWVKAF